MLLSWSDESGTDVFLAKTHGEVRSTLASKSIWINPPKEAKRRYGLHIVGDFQIFVSILGHKPCPRPWGLGIVWLLHC